jgi:transposase-like protein
MKEPRTLSEAIIYFSDPDRAFQYAIDFRWKGGRVTCPRCGGENHSFIKTRRIWYCNPCKKQFTLKVGTIFEDSALSLDKWMTTYWMLVNCKNGVSSCEIASTLGITQKSAWFMLQRLRLGLQDDAKGGKLSGEVEIDETFIGGKARNMHREKRKAAIQGRGGVGKAMVLGMLERGGNVRAKVIADPPQADH